MFAYEYVYIGMYVYYTCPVTSRHGLAFIPPLEDGAPEVFDEGAANAKNLGKSGKPKCLANFSYFDYIARRKRVKMMSYDLLFNIHNYIYNIYIHNIYIYIDSWLFKHGNVPTTVNYQA